MSATDAVVGERRRVIDLGKCRVRHSETHKRYCSSQPAKRASTRVSVSARVLRREKRLRR